MTGHVWIVETNLIAHFIAEIALHFLADSLGEGHCCNSTRLSYSYHQGTLFGGSKLPGTKLLRFVDELRYLSWFSWTRLSTNYRYNKVLDILHNFPLVHNDGQISVCGWLEHFFICDVLRFVLIVCEVNLVDKSQSVIISHHLSFGFLVRVVKSIHIVNPCLLLNLPSRWYYLSYVLNRCWLRQLHNGGNRLEICVWFLLNLFFVFWARWLYFLRSLRLGLFDLSFSIERFSAYELILFDWMACLLHTFQRAEHA